MLRLPEVRLLAVCAVLTIASILGGCASAPPKIEQGSMVRLSRGSTPFVALAASAATSAEVVSALNDYLATARPVKEHGYDWQRFPHVFVVVAKGEAAAASDYALCVFLDEKRGVAAVDMRPLAYSIHPVYVNDDATVSRRLSEALRAAPSESR